MMMLPAALQRHDRPHEGVDRAERRRESADAAVDRRARASAYQLQQWKARNEAAREERDARRREKEKSAEQARERRGQRRAMRRQQWLSLGAWLQRVSPVIGRRVLLVGPIVGPMAVAWIGQMGFALTVLDWPLIGAVLFAAGWELSTVYVGWLAYQARQDGDQARLLRVMTWVFAASAATMNYWHAAPDWRPNPVAVAYGAMSLAGITLWELYATWQHRRRLREAGMAPPARPRFGAARWLRFPRMTWHAWSIAIRDDLSSSREALARARSMRHGRDAPATYERCQAGDTHVIDMAAAEPAAPSPPSPCITPDPGSDPMDPLQPAAVPDEPVMPTKTGTSKKDRILASFTERLAGHDPSQNFDALAEHLNWSQIAREAGSSPKHVRDTWADVRSGKVSLSIPSRL